MNADRNLMTNKGLQCHDGVCGPVTEIADKLYTEIKTKPSTKILLAILVPMILLIFGSVGSLAMFQMKNQQDMSQKIYEKISEINKNVEIFTVQLKSTKELGDRDSTINRQRIERLESWKERSGK
jgi:preprotein translocase subunit YajC